MRWIVIFTNKPDTEDLRLRYLAAHMEYFKNCDMVTLAGATTAHDTEVRTGGVWIIKGVTYDRAVKICEDDPFFKAGLRASMNILSYKVAPQFEETV
ncbi:MAG: YciI family protein [Devosiaceae bacterium]|nr:YciI family protein [Devosiaceae bacterium]